MSVSTCLCGEYGTHGVSIGVPVVLGKEGVEKIVELELNRKQGKSLRNRLLSIKEAIAALKT